MSTLIKRTLVWKNMVLAILITLSSIHAQNADFNLDGYKSHINFLSDDLLMGRFPGSHGGDIAALYIASQFERCGLQTVSEKQGYFQNVPIRNTSTNYNSANFIITGNGIQEKIEPFDEVLLLNRENSESSVLEGELIFVGYGIEAPEYGWDDFKGKDVKGKILVCLNEHPDFQTPDYKSGYTTYYGHWEYRPKVAFDKGAIGILIVHEKQSTFPWHLWQDLLSTSYYSENMKAAPLPLISHITAAAFDKALINIGLNTEVLIENAKQKNFSPFPLQLNIRTEFTQNIEELESPNVVGLIPGYEKPDEAVIYMAHYDHLGTGIPINGDSIYNGAIDNASGTAALLTLAEYFSKHPQKRSIIFLATTAEEIGFLGAEYYLENPVIALENTVIGLNMDMLNFLGTKDSLELSPLVFTDAVKTISELSREMNLGLILSDYDNEFINFRLDSYPFALHDIVTFNILNLHIQGNYLSMPDSEKNDIIEAGGLNYHTPFDEVKPWFRYDGILQELELAKEAGIYYATDGLKPKFNKENPFAPAKLLWEK